MADKQNSAFRLYRFVEKMLPHHPPQQQIAYVLLKSFGLHEGASQREQNATLARVMLLLFNELDSLVADLRRGGHSEQSIQNIVRPFESLSGVGLASQWSAYSSGFSAVLPLLLMVGETLPTDSEPISDVQLSELTNAVGKLRSEVQECALPESVKRFVLEQLDIIARAVRDYPLAGANAFKSAVREAIFHAGEHSDIVAEYKDTPVINSLKQIQEKAVNYAKYAIEVSRFIGTLDSLYKHLQGAAPIAHHLTGLVQHVIK